MATPSLRSVAAWVRAVVMIGSDWAFGAALMASVSGLSVLAGPCVRPAIAVMAALYGVNRFFAYGKAFGLLGVRNAD